MPKNIVGYSGSLALASKKKKNIIEYGANPALYTTGENFSRIKKEEISLVHDLSYGTDFYGTYFSKNKPLTGERFGTKK